MHDNEKLLDAMYAGWREKDKEGLLNCFSEDCTYEDMAMEAIFRGKAEIAAFVNEVYKTMPHFHVVYTKRFANDDFGAGEWVIQSKWNGEFEGVDCTGKEIKFSGLSYYHFADGKITSVQDCWNYVVMMRGFGVLSEELKKLA